MKSRRFIVAGLFGLAVAGCQADPQVALLERQNRLLEDEIYRLREVIEDYRSGMRPTPADTAPPGRPGSGSLEPGAPGRVTLPPGIAEPAESLPTTTPPSQPRLQPPVVSPGEPVPEEELPGVLKKYEDSTVPGDEAVPDNSAGSEKGPMIPADSSRVTRLVFNRQLTGGYNADGRPGDEGIMLVLEPRDARGRRLEAPAAVSVVALDRAMEGEAARVARWDFTAAETAPKFFRSGLGQGLALELGWPSGPPAHHDIHLFVRYTTSDGRKLEVDDRVEVELPGGRSASWVPSRRAAPRRQASRPERPTPPRPTPAVRPATPKLRPPVWSPDRP